MAYDRIEPPDLWQQTHARLLYRLVCLWTTGKSPRFAEFLPDSVGKRKMTESEIVGAFGFRPAK